MNKFISGLLAFIIYTQPVLAGSSRTISADNTEGFFSSQNLAVDGGFEGSNKGTAWVASGGSFAVTSTTPAKGNYHATWDASANAQTLKSKLVAIPPIMYGKNGVVSCAIKDSNGLAAYTITASNGTDDLATATRMNSSTTSYIRTSVNFVFPSSGSIQVKLAATQDEVSIALDDCYLGLADGFNLGSVSQATIVGTVKITGCSTGHSTTSTTFASLGTQTGCSYAVTGSAQAPSTNLMAAKFGNLGPGEYEISYEGTLQQSTSAKEANFQFTDGTNTAREISAYYTHTGGAANWPSLRQTFTLTSPSTSPTWEIYGRTNSGGTAYAFGTTGNPGVIVLKKFPSTSETVYRADQLDYGWTTYTPTISAGFGAATNISFASKRTGDTLHVKGTFTAGTMTAALGTFSLPSGLTIDTNKISINNTTSNPGERVGFYESGTATNQFGPIVTAPSTSTSLVYIGNNVGAAANLTPSLANATISSSNVVSVNFSVPISGWVGVSSPVFVGSVTSNSAGAERIERASVTNSAGAWTVASKSGTWITSVTDNDTGDATLVVPSGMFSSAPSCVCTLTTGVNPQNCQIRTPTTTAVRVVLINEANNAFQDGDFDIICMGPR